MNTDSYTTDESLPPYYLLLTLWGHRFCDIACRFTFASLLSERNIPFLKDRKTKFLIATTAEDWKYLEGKPIFRTLRKHINVEFVPNEDTAPPLHKYIRMSRGHAMLAERCFQDKAVAININPDSLYPDGSIAEAIRLQKAGKDVILCAAVRFDMEGVEHELSSRGLIESAKPLNLTMRAATAIGLRNFHPETRASNWTAENFGRLHRSHQRKHFLTCCYWEAPAKDGVVIITHNWSPFMVNYGALGTHDTNALDGRALDGNYIFENFSSDTHSIHVVDDSDSLFLLGLTPHDEMRPPQDRKWWKNCSLTSEWTRGYILNRTVFDSAVDEPRRRIYRMPVRWHGHDINDSWKPVEAEVKRLIDEYVTHDLDLTRPSPRYRRLTLLLLRPLMFWQLRFVAAALTKLQAYARRKLRHLAFWHRALGN